MIAGSLLLILVAVALLAWGLVQGANSYLVGSIGASLLAAIALIVGSRRAGRRGEDAQVDVAVDAAVDRVAAGRGETATRHAPREASTEIMRPARTEAADRRRAVGLDDDADHPPAGRRVQTMTEPSIPAQSAAPEGRGASHHAAAPADDDYDDDEDPPDEPVAQQVSPADSARVARLSTDVLVIDGRPRYHLAGCVHLLGRESEPLPVAEAIELGFTPCGLCEPDSALLAEARRV